MSELSAYQRGWLAGVAWERSMDKLDAEHQSSCGRSGDGRPEVDPPPPEDPTFVRKPPPKWLTPTPNCRGCGKPIVFNDTLADACPCNSPRGINHGLVPTSVCTCVECDPAQTGSARKEDGQSWAAYMPAIVRAK
jgi:hypothetical protein